MPNELFTSSEKGNFIVSLKKYFKHDGYYTFSVSTTDCFECFNCDMRFSILNILGASEYFRKHRQALLASQFVLLNCHEVGKASPVMRLSKRKHRSDFEENLQ